MDFGCFVELMGFQKKSEGLVHLSNISATKRAGSAKDMVGKGEFQRGEGGAILEVHLFRGLWDRARAWLLEELHAQHVLAAALVTPLPALWA